jgi:PmbA protein
MAETKTNPAGNVEETARQALEIAKKRGAKECAVTASRARGVQVTWRDGKLEKLEESTTRNLGLELYVDGRYSTVATNDMRPEALDSFIADAIALARTLAVDPFRALPDAALYAGQASVELGIDDPAQTSLTPDQRKRWVREMEAAARSTDAKGAMNSVTTSFGDGWMEVYRVASNGFEGRRRQTTFNVGTDVSVKDADGRRPEDGMFASTRFLADLPSAQKLGEEAGRRTLGRLGQIKAKSAKMNVVVENQTVRGLLGRGLGALTGAALQQKRSFLDGRLGQTLGSPKLTLIDDPHLVRGQASRLWDGEGLATKRRPIFEGGTLQTYFIDAYYGRKLKMTPTTGGPSNLVLPPGDRSLAQLVSDARDGVFITGFLGGNSNDTSGDFSLGISGNLIRNGQLAEPIGEMNIAGNYLDLWKRLSAVGNDPWMYSSGRLPSLLFDGISIAGA